jgi:hypothetical protein
MSIRACLGRSVLRKAEERQQKRIEEREEGKGCESFIWDSKIASTIRRSPMHKPDPHQACARRHSPCVENPTSSLSFELFLLLSPLSNPQSPIPARTTAGTPTMSLSRITVGDQCFCFGTGSLLIGLSDSCWCIPTICGMRRLWRLGATPANPSILPRTPHCGPGLVELAALDPSHISHIHSFLCSSSPHIISLLRFHREQDNSCALQELGCFFYSTHECIFYSIKSYSTAVKMTCLTNGGDNSKVDVLVVGAGPAG